MDQNENKRILKLITQELAKVCKKQAETSIVQLETLHKISQILEQTSSLDSLINEFDDINLGDSNAVKKEQSQQQSTQSHQKEVQDPEIQNSEYLVATMEFSKDYESIVERRKELHRQLGTYDESKDSTEVVKVANEVDNIKETPLNDMKPPLYPETKDETKDDSTPMLNPLHKLNYKELDELQRNIFKKAVFNVETILQIKRDDENFKDSVKAESDRLLEVWKASS